MTSLEATITFTCPTLEKDVTVKFSEIDIELNSGYGGYSCCGGGYVENVEIYCECGTSHILNHR